jgi:Flp pilus assembly protein TadG
MSADRDRGAAAVEFALILCFVLLPVVWAIIDLGRAYNAKLTLTHSAREAVRVWALTGDLTKTSDAAEASAVGLDVDVTTTLCTFGDPTTVTVTASFTYLTPLLGEAIPVPETFAATGVMRCGG